MSATVGLLKQVALPLLLVTAGIWDWHSCPIFLEQSCSFTLRKIFVSSRVGSHDDNSDISRARPHSNAGRDGHVSLTSSDGIITIGGVDYNGNGVSDPGRALVQQFRLRALLNLYCDETPGTYTTGASYTKANV